MPNVDFAAPVHSCNPIHIVAAKIFLKYTEDEEFNFVVNNSNEPYRAMHCESGLADYIVDGSPEYHKLIDTLEYLMSDDAEEGDV